jgi:insulysin
MLFLGTEKYPDENSYSEFLSAHGGNHNAYTSTEDTNYYFDVTQEHLEPALDRFAQFFVAPLFTQTATDREMKAVDNENSKNVQSDFWRLFQLVKSSAKVEHPFHKFGTGNLQTLRDDPISNGVDIRSELLKFHKQYYSAGVMKLTILGRESLDELENMVHERFAAVPNTGRAAPEFSSDVFDSSSLAKMYRIMPVKDLRILSLYWPMPSVEKLYHTKPTHLLAHLIGHEGAGSILSLLKKNLWANGLSAGPSQTTSCFSMFAVSIDLTEDGLEHIDDIMQTVYQYLELMRKATPEEWRAVYEETRDVSAMNFRFKSKENPISYVTSVARNMQKYDNMEILSGPWLQTDFDEKELQGLMDLMTPDNMRVEIVSKQIENKTTQVEQWYKTEYAVEDLSENVKAQVASPGKNDELALPKPNPFIATDFELRTLSEEDAKKQPYGPVVIESASDLKCWFKVDTVFRKPKLYTLIRLDSPLSGASPHSRVATELFVELLTDSLVEFAYDAEVAGLVYSVESVVTGLQCSVRGYHHKLPTIARAMLKRIRDMDIRQDRLDVILERYVRRMRNFGMDQPYQHAMYHRSMSTEIGRWHAADKLQAASRINAADIETFRSRFLRELNVKVLSHGNADEKEALAIVQMAREELKFDALPVARFPEQRFVQLLPRHTYVVQSNVLNNAEANSASFVYFQIGESTMEVAALTSLLAQIINEPCYDQLRTKEQLGYLVHSSLTYSRGVVGMRFIVQSSKKAPDYLEQRIEAFLAKFESELQEMTDEKFTTHRAALIAKKLEKDKNLHQETSSHWGEIVKHRFHFNRRRDTAKHLESVTKDDILSFFRNFLSMNGAKRAKLAVRVFGSQHHNADIEDTSICKLLSSLAPTSSSDAATPAEDERTPEEEPTPELEDLPPVPEDTTTVEYVTDYESFRRHLPLFPDFVSTAQ